MGRAFPFNFTGHSRRRKPAARFPHPRPGLMLLLLPAVLLSTFACVCARPTHSAAAGSPPLRHILILNSYHLGYPWSDSEVRGIESVIGREKGRYDLLFAYMDSKRFMDAEYQRKLADLLEYKYSKVPLALVLALDNDALRFLQQNGQKIFPDVPVVFCGINDYSDAMIAGFPHITGVVETPDYAGTVELALRLRPSARQVVVISDATVTGLAHEHAVKAIEQQFEGRARFVFWSLAEYPLDLMQNKLAHLGTESVVLMLSAFIDGTGRTFSMEEGLERLVPGCGVPVFVLTDVRVGLSGVLGGRVVSGTSQGTLAATLALRVLNGEPAETVPVMRTSPNQVMLDYRALRRWNIPESALPPESLIINRPQTLWSRYRNECLLAGAAFTLLSGLVLLLVLVLLRYRAAQASLQHSRERFEGLLRTTPVGVMETDARGRITYVNRQWCTLSGLQPEQAMDEGWAQVLDGEERRRVIRDFSHALKTAAPFEGTYRLQRTDGTSLWVYGQAVMLRNAAGQVTGSVGTMTEIGKLKTFEAQLQRSNRALKVLGECNQLLVKSDNEMQMLERLCDILVNLGGYRFAWVGYRQDDTQKTVRPAAHRGQEQGYLSILDVRWDDSPLGSGPTGTAIRTGSPCVVQDTASDPAFAHRKAEALARNFASAASLPLIYENTNFGALTLYADTPGAFDAQEMTILGELASDLAFGIATLRARESLRFTQFTVDHAPVGVVWTDAQGRIRYANQETARLHRCTRETLIGSLVTRWVSGLTEERWRKYWDRLRPAGKPVQLSEMQILDAGGAPCAWMSVSSMYLEHSGREYAVHVGFDLTESRRTREALGGAISQNSLLVRQLEEEVRHANRMAMEARAASIAKGFFLANMSHEIRTPMNAILGFADLLAQQDLPFQQAEFLRIIKDNCQSLLGILNGILDLSRIEAGKVEVVEQDFDLAPFIDDLLKLFTVKIQGKKLSLESSLAPDVPARLRGDVMKLRQVLVNLIDNAIKYTAAGSVSVGVMREETNGGGLPGLHFTVRDTGTGIPHGMLERIFEPFAQADPSYTRKYNGTGLGLTIVRSNVELLGGTVWVESSVGHGSTFHFTARLAPAESRTGTPAAPASANGHQRPAAPASGKAALHLPYPVLVVEDNPSNQLLIVSLLKSLGVQSQTAENGLEAVEVFQKKQFSLILMDIQMPEMNGIDATIRIRELEREMGAHIPIIALTAHAMEDDHRQCSQAGMDGYLPKPVSKPDLVTGICNVLAALSPQA